MKRAVQSALLLLLLCGCEQTVTATVTRFSTLSPTAPAHQSVTILPQGPQVGDLQFQHTAALVAAALQGHGFQAVPSNSTPPPDLLVFLQYGPAGARQQVIDYGYGPRWSPWWGFPPYDVYTLYSQFLEVDIADGAAWRRGERRMVFQGRAFAETGVQEFNVVVPYLVDALFKNFPGVNGETVKVTIPVTRPN